MISLKLSETRQCQVSLLVKYFLNHNKGHIFDFADKSINMLSPCEFGKTEQVIALFFYG